MKNTSNNKKIWVDIINPSDALFFGGLVHHSKDTELSITLRQRAETVELASLFGLSGRVIGKDRTQPIQKICSIIIRTLTLLVQAPKHDVSLSFEDASAVVCSKIRRKKSVMFCDNDLKFIQKSNKSQDIDTLLKLAADYIVIPEACYNTFKQHVDEKKLITYNGYKEDIYIANYAPNPDFLKEIPFEHYVVLRPEALGSFYVSEKTSITQQLLTELVNHEFNVVYLPREGNDREYANNSEHIFIPDHALNGLDLCYYSDAVLTGSGTMCREAACIGKKSVSFFPGNNLLSVDQKLVDEKRVLHSRDVGEIVQYLVDNSNDSIYRNNSWEVKNNLITKLVQQVNIPIDICERSEGEIEAP